ncbi:VOC family protein [Streptomyces cinereospinus]
MSEKASTPVHWKLVVDAADPHAQADFWAAALGYETEDNSALIERLLTLGALPAAATVDFHGRPAFRDLVAVRHPDDPYEEESGTGLGRRVLFKRVPEPKAGKNRLHLDLHPAGGGGRTRWSGCADSGRACCGRSRSPAGNGW